MLVIDGAQHSGSGTLVRFSVALAAILGQPLELKNARAKRDHPGLRHQHLAAVKAAADLCAAEVEGAEVGSKAITFRPGARPQGGAYHWDIGTAVRYTESLGYKGLYSLEINNAGHGAIRLAYNTILANLA